MNAEASTVFIIDGELETRISHDSLFGAAGFGTESYSSAEEFLNNFDPNSQMHRQGCALVDVSLPGMTGLELQENLTANEVDLPIIFITCDRNIPQCVKAMKAGAVDVLEKTCRDTKLMRSVREALNQYENSHQEHQRRTSIKQRLSLLTRRERQILALLVSGESPMSSEKIGEKLFISRRTVEHHRAAVKEKMHARSLLELIDMARDCGFHL
jgi:FixJ family two-component response regulator